MAIRWIYRLSAIIYTAVILCCAGALGSYSVDFSASDLTLSARDGGVAVGLADCGTMGVTWMPDLPTKGISIAIPYDMDATGVRIVNVEYVDLPGVYRIAPCEPPVSAGATRARPATTRSAVPEAVRFPRGIYPGELVRLGGCGWMSDHHLASVTVYPVQYDTITGALRLYTHIEFDLVMTAGASDAPAIAVRSATGEDAFASMAKSLVINPLDVKPAPAQWGAARTTTADAEYLIITSANLASYFQPLIEWKHAKGYTAAIVTTATISTEYSGDAQYSDLQAKIRACILDYKTNHGTVWVLLGGDTARVPARLVWFFESQADDTSPSDIYYMDLQGTWDYNGNGLFGENNDGVNGAKPDMIPDVFLARAPVNNPTQIATFINKVLQYEGAPSKPALPIDFELRALLLGGILDWEDEEQTDPGTDGSVQMEYFATLIPGRFTKTKLYEINHTLTHAATVTHLNNGQNIAAHAQHGNASCIALAKGEEAFWETDAYAMTNKPNYTGFLASWSCSSGRFDRDDGGRCVAESFLLAPNGGGFYIGNSRDSSYYVGDPMNALGPRVVTETMRSVFTRNKARFGEIFASTVSTIAPFTKVDPGGGSWERRTIGIAIPFGDPETPIWTDAPVAMTVTHPTSMNIGSANVTVNVKKNGVNQLGAKVCLLKDADEVYAVGTTNSYGNASFAINPLTVGTMTVTVTKNNLLPFQGTVQVVDPSITTTAPLNWINIGWNWISFPLAPVDPSPETIFGVGVARNRLYYWDPVGKTIMLYPDSFTSVATGLGYLLSSEGDQNPSYNGYPNPDGFEISVPIRGWTWIGQPYDKWSEQGGTQVRNNALGVVRTPAEDYAAPDPWLNWNWIYWDSVGDTACICNHNGSGESTSLGPWRAYRVWANVDNLTLIMH